MRESIVANAPKVSTAKSGSRPRHVCKLLNGRIVGRLPAPDAIEATTLEKTTLRRHDVRAYDVVYEEGACFPIKVRALWSVGFWIRLGDSVPCWAERPWAVMVEHRRIAARRPLPNCVLLYYRR